MCHGPGVDHDSRRWIFLFRSFTPKERIIDDIHISSLGRCRFFPSMFSLCPCALNYLIKNTISGFSGVTHWHSVTPAVVLLAILVSMSFFCLDPSFSMLKFTLRKEYFGLKGVLDQPSVGSSRIPAILFCIYQLMFAAITYVPFVFFFKKKLSVKQN